MPDERPPDRFDYPANLGRAGGYQTWRSAHWPPAARWELFLLDLDRDLPEPAPTGELAALREAVDAELRSFKAAEAGPRTAFDDPARVAAAIRAVAARLPDPTDRRAAALRADAVEHGYTEEILQELAKLEEGVAIVAGHVATWYGKDRRGLPTAFAARRDEQRQAQVIRAQRESGDVAAYLRRLHAALRPGEAPAFAATRLFFMAGEGDAHPKHIAYFLPEDEGVKRSPYKKTYYFATTHAQIVESVSAPLAERHLRIGTRFEPSAAPFAAIPTLGVFGHELGHGVHRPTTSYKALNAADRWASVVLQEVCADVFGALILADVWAPNLGLEPVHAVAYYLAECLRYTSRGLGHFPDGDGMYLQLSYYVQLGALALETDAATDEPVLAGDPEAVLAGLRSLGRVLADAVLDGRAEPAVALHRAFGPAGPDSLRPLIDRLRGTPFPSVEYTQERSHAAAHNL